MKWKELRKIGVSGSRRFYKPDMATQFLDQYIRKNFKSTEDVVILTGNAVGLDAAVEQYCMRRGIKNLIVNARWLELEKSAGPRRNQHIVDLSNEMFFFWDGESTGTKDALMKCKVRGIPYRLFTLKSLTKEIGIKPPPIVVIPERRKLVDTSKRDVHKIRTLVEAADMDDLIVRKKPKRKVLSETYNVDSDNNT